MDRIPNYDLNLKDNITWQYDDAPNLNKLIDKKNDWYVTTNKNYWLNWTSSVFNLKTANQFGCVVWAIILKVPVSLIFTPAVNRPPFGFGNGRGNFQNSNFFGSATTGVLTIDEARRLLQMRYYAQTMSPNVSNINSALKAVFGDLGVAYIEQTSGGINVPPFGFGSHNDNFLNGNFNPNQIAQNVIPMGQKYIFKFSISSNLKNALLQYDILPRGSGVVSTIVSP